MRISSRPKSQTTSTREERLREGRAAAATLRIAAPNATLLEVQLVFVPETAPLHAAQSITLYPSARAFFAYPCPYGDCDGIFDFNVEAHSTFERDAPEMSGTVMCSGYRSRDGLQRQPCGQWVRYRIRAHHALR
jgi:hypothetical protein